MEVVLVEPGKNGAINAKKRNIDNVICSTLEDAGFKNSSFDSVGLFDVIEHIKNDVAFLKEVHAYLKDDGLVYITVPAYNLLWSNEDNDTGHYRRYTLKKLRRLMSEAGYKITYETYIFSILPIPIFLFRTIPSFLKLNKNSNELKKHQNEHRAKEGVLNKIWSWEIERGKASKKIRFGGSCFIVAQKQ
jgi:2-polyprenyl-3-methyl-5-hydroxy-6-metoxy-1,4-benzoquinol methylase